MSQLLKSREEDERLTYFSVVSHYCFGADDDVVGDAARASTLRNNLSRMLQGVKFNYHFGWISGLIPFLPMAVGNYVVPAGVRDMLDFRKVNPPIKSNL